MTNDDGQKISHDLRITRPSGETAAPVVAFHVVAKPIGPACNLRCEYCFYLEKSAFFPTNASSRMSHTVLEAFIKKYLLSNAASEVTFVWQGGEPMLLGIDFYREVINLQQRYGSGRYIVNALQTNGTRLNDAWCDFLAQHRFLVGLSLDGPAEVHDRYRRDAAGQSTFPAVMRGLELLNKHGVEFNVLAAVSDYAATQPREIYDFFNSQGVQFLQFTPIVERLPDAAARDLALRLAMPAKDMAPCDTPLTPWSVDPEQYADFLLAIFHQWVSHDVGEVYVMNFDWALGAWLGLPSGVCVFAPRCGDCLAIEHNGDVYACDHYVYPQYKLGNVLTDEFPTLLARPEQQDFGAGKEMKLPLACLSCEVLPACRGGCPKHRFTHTAGGEPGLNYLCPGYKKFFLGIAPHMKAIRLLLEKGQSATRIMETEIMVKRKYID